MLARSLLFVYESKFRHVLHSLSNLLRAAPGLHIEIEYFRFESIQFRVRLGYRKFAKFVRIPLITHSIFVPFLNGLELALNEVFALFRFF